MATEELTFRGILDNSLKVLIPAGVGLTAAACNYAFHWGFCKHFAIPPWYITFDTVSLFVYSTFGLSFLLVQAYLFSKLTYLCGSPTRAFFAIGACYYFMTVPGIGLVNGIAFQFLLLMVSMVAQNSKRCSAWWILLILPVSIFIAGGLLLTVFNNEKNMQPVLVIPMVALFAVSSGTWFLFIRFRWEYYKITASSESNETAIERYRFSYETILFIAILAVSPIVLAAIIGNAYAVSKNRYTLIEGFEDCVLVAKYGDNILLSDVDRIGEMLAVGDSYQVVSVESISGKKQTTKETGAIYSKYAADRLRGAVDTAKKSPQDKP